MSHWLVTGTGGLLGANLVVEASKTHRVTGVDHHKTPAGAPVKVIQVDLNAEGCARRLIEDNRPDVIIHCAALANVDECEHNPELAKRTNTWLPGELAAAAASAGCTFVHISTDAVFDGQTGHYTETDKPNPLSVYARTKLEGETAVLDANPVALVARTNIFGWSPSGKRSLAEWFHLHLFKGEAVNGFTDVFFCPLLTNDLAGILLKMIERGLKGVYHTVSSESTSKYDFGVRIARRFRLDERLIRPISVMDGGLAAQRSPNLTLETGKLSSALGERLPGLDEAIDRFYFLYQEGFPEKLHAWFFSS